MLHEKKTFNSSKFAHCRFTDVCPAKSKIGFAKNCVPVRRGKEPARKKEEWIVPKMVKKTGKTFWNSTRRTIETQSWIANRFKKAMNDAEPIVLAPREAQKIEETSEDCVGPKKGLKQKIFFDPKKRILSAKNLLSLRPLQPIKFFKLPNFAEQSPDMSVRDSAKYWKDLRFFYVDKNLFKNKYYIFMDPSDQVIT